MEVGLDRAGPFIRRAIDQERNARLNQGAGAHGARFDSRINDGVGQPVITKLFRRFPERHYFGVRGWVAICARAITGHRQQFIANDDACAHRDFAGSFRFTRGVDGFTHPALVRGLSLSRGINSRNHLFKQQRATIGLGQITVKQVLKKSASPPLYNVDSVKARELPRVSCYYRGDFRGAFPTPA